MENIQTSLVSIVVTVQMKEKDASSKGLSNWQRLASNYPTRHPERCNIQRVSAWFTFCFNAVVVRNPVLIRKSMELIKEMTQILREIIASGDEERFRHLQEIIHALNDSRQDLGSRVLH